MSSISLVKGVPSDIFTSVADQGRFIPGTCLDTLLFEQGRSYRTFLALEMSEASVRTIRVVIPKNLTADYLELTCYGGNLTMETISGGTAEGTYDVTLPMIPRNAMTTATAVPAGELPVITTGGTVTGGTIVDIVNVKAPNEPIQVVPFNTGDSSRRAFPPSTIFLKITSAGSAAGIFKVGFTVR